MSSNEVRLEPPDRLKIPVKSSLQKNGGLNEFLFKQMKLSCLR